MMPPAEVEDERHEPTADDLEEECAWDEQRGDPEWTPADLEGD